MLVLLITLYFAISLQLTTACTGYYWREYTGTIPDDALKAGLNTNGSSTYVGQVLHEEQLIPAKIDPEEPENKVIYEWGSKEHIAHMNIKILCSRYPEDFEWIKTGNMYFNELKDKHLVPGGYEPKLELYVGRKQMGNELAVGKIVHGRNWATLSLTKDGRGHAHRLFEILTYNPNKTNKNHANSSSGVKNNEQSTTESQATVKQ